MFSRGILAVLVLATPAAVAGPVIITVRNPTADSWVDAPVVLAWTPLMEHLGPGDLALVGNDTLAVQRDDLNGNGTTDELAFVVSLRPGESRRYALASAPAGFKPARRAYARMSLKGYDGVGWESDVMAYRIYWNADNAMDIFGKTRPILSLDAWATPGVSHQIENEYGVDVLKVGRALGIGGFGAWINGRIEKVTNVMKDYRIRAAGPVRAVVDLEYVYWQPGPLPDLSRQAITSNRAPHYDLNVRMSIFAGQRWGEADILVRPYPGSPMPEIVTGLPRQDDTTLIEDRAAGILARWGRQALGDREVPRQGNLGLGVLADPDRIVAFGEDTFNTYMRLKPERGRVRYRYHGSWWKEPGAAGSAREYEEMLRAVLRQRPEVTIEGSMTTSAPDR